MKKSLAFYLLLPFAGLYDLNTRVRNWLYDKDIILSEQFDLPVISIGNLAVGGTGKTPHTEYLVRLLLRHGYNVAVLSRGYKRKTRGFVLATPTSTVADIGDEPLQMARKFPPITVAVCEDRCQGIRQFLSLPETRKVDVILLDDAFQHRKLRAGFSILLSDSTRPYPDDYLLPSGRLREAACGAKRADMVVLTKCVGTVDAQVQAGFAKKLNLRLDQELYFTRIRYSSTTHLAGNRLLLVTGIANPSPLEAELRRTTKVETMHFGDHHNFTTNDLQRIRTRFETMPAGKNKRIVTTEKDWVRLAPMLSENERRLWDVISIQIEFINDNDKFNQAILNYVRENQRNSGIPQK